MTGEKPLFCRGVVTGDAGTPLGTCIATKSVV
jgi:hypothetical protein